MEANKANEVGGAPSMSALALSRLCYDTLLADGPAALAAVEANAVTPAVERLIEANTLLSGLGFESAGLAVAHSVHNGLTMLGPTHEFLHGEKVAFGLLVQLAVEGRPSSEFRDVVDFCRGVGFRRLIRGQGPSDGPDRGPRVTMPLLCGFPGTISRRDPRKSHTARRR